MYRRTYYNKDAILNTETQTIYFKGDQGYDEYLLWVAENKLADSKDKRTQEALLLWNGGKPHKVGNRLVEYNMEGVKVGETIYLDGERSLNLFDREGNRVTTENFDKNGKLKSKDFIRDDKKVVTENYDGEERISKIDYDYKGEVYSYSTWKFGIKVIIQYHKKLPIKKLFVKDKKVLRSANYYPNSKQPKKYVSWVGDIHKYKEYYPSGKLRSKGDCIDEEIPNGDWEFYHHNGRLESKHTFDKGKLVGKSTLFYEDGTFNTAVEHD